MIKVTADIFSGRPNPEWIVEGNEAEAVLQKLSQARESVASLDSGFNGLGNRGLIVEVLSDHLQLEGGVSPRFRLAGGGSSDEGHAREIAEQLVRGMTQRGAGKHPALAAAQTDSASALAVPLNAQLQRFILESLPASVTDVRTQSTSAKQEEMKSSTIPPKKACDIETAVFNPGFWNDSAHIGKNNCYNYASDRRTDTFAQPGRASGHMYARINCGDVTNGAVSDGASLNCAPANQAPRWYMALVIAPGPGFIDYHWYRLSKEGFWGHKPGGTAARNTDNSGHIVNNPQTANRGPYTIFCRYIYAQKRMVVR
jgi:hypothetical protein